MNYYVISFESVRGGDEGAPWFGKKIIKCDDVLTAQNKFLAWIQAQPQYTEGIKRLFFAVDETTQDVLE